MACFAFRRWWPELPGGAEAAARARSLPTRLPLKSRTGLAWLPALRSGRLCALQPVSLCAPRSGPLSTPWATSLLALRYGLLSLLLLASLAFLPGISAAQASPLGPVADGPYVGTLPCADCDGIRTALTLYSAGAGGAPLVYRMTSTYLGIRNGSRTSHRTEERMGPWLTVGEGAAARVRIEPYNDAARQSFRRTSANTLVLLDRREQPIATQHNGTLWRDPSDAPARLAAPPTLFRGTLTRDADRLLLAPCGGGTPVRVQDVSPEVIITAALTDIGFDRLGRVYLEAYGRLQDGALWIGRLNRAGTEMGCPSEVHAFRAHGNEPSWGLVSTVSGVALTRFDGAAHNASPRASLSAPPVPLSWRWPGGRSDRAEATLALSTESGALTAVLAPRICRDTMADNVYGFTATVRVARPTPATVFKGCAFLGSEALPSADQQLHKTIR